MTVCIAAVCGVAHEKGPFVIAAADRMITIGDIQYEPAQTKLVNLASQTIALCAGDMQLHAAVIPRVHERIKRALADNPENISVADIAEIYAEEFGYYRRTQAEKDILVPRGLNFDRFLTRQSSMAHYQVAEIDARLASYFIGSTAIVAGIDPTGGHLFKIENPGKAECYDTPFFAAIGSGAALAETQFMVKRFDKTWEPSQTLWLTFEAKSRAEVAGGVGVATDVVIIRPGGQITPLTGPEKIMLHELYREVVTKEAEVARGAVSKIEEYISQQASGDDSSMEQTAAVEEPPPASVAKTPARQRPSKRK